MLHHQELYLFLPGFPGEAIPRTEGETRVVDVISKTLISKGKRIEIINYPGILDKNEFSFEKTKNIVFSTIDQRMREGFSINLIGQSWGGMIALLGALNYSINHTLLITPFLILPEGEDLQNILFYYSAEFPQIISSENIPALTKQINKLKNELKEREQTLINAKKISVLLCKDDLIVPVIPIVSFLDKLFFSNNIEVLEIQNDHDFTQGKEQLVKWLANCV